MNGIVDTVQMALIIFLILLAIRQQRRERRIWKSIESIWSDSRQNLKATYEALKALADEVARIGGKEQ